MPPGTRSPAAADRRTSVPRLSQDRCVTGVVAKCSHEIPDRAPMQLAAGERVDASERSSEWREHVFVTAEGGSGWVPVRSLSGSSGMVTVRTPYDTTELATSAGEHLE